MQPCTITPQTVQQIMVEFGQRMLPHATPDQAIAIHQCYSNHEWAEEISQSINGQKKHHLHRHHKTQAEQVEDMDNNRVKCYE